MKVNTLILNITSDNPERLMAFYDTLGLPKRDDMGEWALDIAGAAFTIDGHSETHGPAKEPQRVLLNMFVDDIDTEQAALEAKGIKFIRSKGVEFWGGVISTFQDPDGNYLQLIQYKPELAVTEPASTTA